MKTVPIEQIDFSKGGGLVPVVVQEYSTGEVLMLAYTDRGALERTIQTGLAHYWSRSRRKLWMKGETSDNIQMVKKIVLDCDRDTLLYIVEQKGNACHKGERSCFHTILTKNSG